jgi:ketosteroid isomerase-like protein
LLLTLACSVNTDQPDRISRLESLVAAEREFSALSATDGVRKAFLTNMVDSVVLFRPMVVVGKKVYEKASEVPGQLIWRPIVADVSLAGDMGFSTGPFQLRRNPSDSLPASVGFFLSVWRRGADQHWKVELDAGIRTPQYDTTTSIAYLEQSVNTWTPLTKEDFLQVEHLLTLREHELSMLSQKNGAGAALRSCADRLIRIYREDMMPMIGEERLTRLVVFPNSEIHWNTYRAIISESGDRAYTYGEALIAGKDPAKFSYVHLWKKDSSNQWKIILDFMIPIPKEAEKKN